MQKIGKNRLFCNFYVTKYRKTCYKAYFFFKIFGGFGKKQYFCTVFFMVLDLRLSKDWVVVMTILLFFFCFLESFCTFAAGMEVGLHRLLDVGPLCCRMLDVRDRTIR